MDKDFNQNEITIKKLIINSLMFAISGFVGLVAIYATDVFTPYPSTWLLILHIVLIVIIQWCVIVCAFYFDKLRLTSNVFKLILKWICAFLPAIIGLSAMRFLYTKSSSDIPQGLFEINMDNFLFGMLGYVVSAFLIFGVIWGIIYVNGGTSRKEKNKKEKKNKKEDKKQLNKIEEEKKDDPDANLQVFPDLLSVDLKYAMEPYNKILSDDITLKQICSNFNMYLESNGMFYTADTIYSFIAGMATSRFIILEGMSGTGKTSLPKYFCEFFKCGSCFTSVQASWKDRSDVLGFYNDFTRKFKETPFLRALYESNYRNDEINLMVLDEMNLSRVEYYFADFLSVLEFDKEKWLIELMPVSTKGMIPNKLVNGCSLRILDNTWFIGTANKDDSTYTITDKVYDRASIIDFNKRNDSNVENHNIKPISVSADKLTSLFDEAIKNVVVSSDAMKKFQTIANFMLEVFDINFGNRIMNQINRYVPVFTACGGSAEKALDIMFSRKILRKLEGKYEDGVKANLIKLEGIIISLFGVENFSCSLEYIQRLKRKLI